MELKGKAIAFLGDSITEGNGVQGLEHRYDRRLKEMAGLRAVYNYGIGGTRYAYQKEISEVPMFDLYFCGRAWVMTRDVDVVVVFGGTNDFGTGTAPFGGADDTRPDTFCGAVEYLMTYLQETYPHAQLVFLTPARRWGDTDPAGNLARRGEPLVLTDFVDVIKAKAAAHGIACLDMYADFPIDPNDPMQRAQYTTDGLHFNNAGHAVIAETLLKFLEML